MVALAEAMNGVSTGVRVVINQNQSDSHAFFVQLTMLIEEGQIQIPQLGVVLPLRDAAKAHELLTASSIRGWIMLEVQ